MVEVHPADADRRAAVRLFGKGTDHGVGAVRLQRSPTALHTLSKGQIRSIKRSRFRISKTHMEMAAGIVGQHRFPGWELLEIRRAPIPHIFFLIGRSFFVDAERMRPVVVRIHHRNLEVGRIVANLGFHRHGDGVVLVEHQGTGHLIREHLDTFDGVGIPL